MGRVVPRRVDAWARLARELEPYRGRIEVDRDDFGGVLVYLRRDMPHLDADALNDRLHAWTAREVERVVPHASAFVSFRRARPASHDEPELSWQDEWLGLEPTFRLEMVGRAPTEEEALAFARLVPAFLAQVEAVGRPAGWRDVDAGNAE